MLFSCQNRGGNIGLLNKLFDSKGTSKSGDISKERERVSSSYFFFGRTTAGRNVNESTTLLIIAAYSCVRSLAETLVGLPVYLYKKGLSFEVDRILKDGNFQG